MYVLIIIFIILALFIGLFSTALVTREVVIDEKERRKKKNAPVVDVMPEEETPFVAEPAVTEDVNASMEEISATEIIQSGESAVIFSTGSKTLDEKYLALSPEDKGYYDEIARFAMTIENSKHYKNSVYEEYKVGKNRLVRLKIKRGIIVCELVIPNLTFKNYVSNNKVSVKQAPAIIKVTDEISLSAVKDSIDIAVKAIEEEKAYKKEQAKIRRRERKAAREVV